MTPAQKASREHAMTADQLRKIANSYHLSRHVKFRRDGAVTTRKGGEVLFFIERDGNGWHPLGVAAWLNAYPSRYEACRIGLRAKAHILNGLTLGQPLCGSCTYYHADPAAPCGGVCSHRGNHWADSYADETCDYHDSKSHDERLCCSCEDEPCGRGER